MHDKERNRKQRLLQLISLALTLNLCLGWQNHPEHKRLNFFVLKSANAKNWVTEGLERSADVTSHELAAHGDRLPVAGLRIGRVHVVAAGVPAVQVAELASGSSGAVRLGYAEGGWGSGCHPSTKLCLEFLSDQISGGEHFLDYGTGRSKYFFHFRSLNIDWNKIF